MSDIVWMPTDNQIQNSQIFKFIEFLRENQLANLADSDALYEWSISNSELFWSSFAKFSQIKFTKPADMILAGGHDMLNAKWFVGSKLNYAENLLRRNDDQLAIVFRGEDKVEWKYTFAEVNDIVARLAQGLRNLGVTKGDRVAGDLPNLPHTVMAMLATTSIGAIWSSCSPDFGVQGVLDRFGQIEPKVVFAVDGYYYNGKQVECLAKVAEIIDKLPSVEKTIIINYAGSNTVVEVKNSISWDAFLTKTPATSHNFEQVDFDHPLFIMYSSGTTGIPKCIVHSTGGTLLQHLKEHQLHTNLKRDSRIFYYTTCGWMMWNWLVSALASEATLMLYDGSPTAPDPKVLWDYVADYHINVFGTSAKYLASLEKTGYKPNQHAGLESLEAILSTGSPLLPESYDFVYRDIKTDVRLCSISGGTDIVSCFVLGNPVKPIHRGEIQQRGFGLSVEVFNDNGESAAINEKGELVCTKPFPCQPIYFWNDPDKVKYKKAYFERFDNIWCHGDYASLSEYGGVVIYGRSDTTLNPGGVRIGTAEIYRQVETIEDIVESVVIGQETGDDVRVILFVKMKDDKVLSEELKTTLKQRIKIGASPRHVPAKIIQVADIPKTISGKVVEMAVKNVVHGEEVKNKESLANPEALDLFANHPELKL